MNIHSRDGALLETTRIAETLSQGGLVVSEDSFDQGDHPLLEALIRFAPRGDMPGLGAVLRAALDDPGPKPDMSAAISASRAAVRNALHDLGLRRG